MAERKGFSSEEIRREHDAATGHDPRQQKRTQPVYDGPHDEGTHVSGQQPSPYEPPGDDGGAPGH